MKRVLILFCTISLFTCETIEDNVIGDWIISNQYYSATYKIVEENNRYKALIMYYDDGTTKFAFDEKNPRALFSDVSLRDNNNVDGYSGATSKTKAQKNFSLMLKSKDSLEVTSFVLGKPQVEIWTKK